MSLIPAFCATIDRDADLMYHSCEDYIADLKTVQRSLAEANAKRSAYGPLQDLIWQAETFGFHMVEMEFRQHSVTRRCWGWPKPAAPFITVLK